MSAGSTPALATLRRRGRCLTTFHKRGLPGSLPGPATMSEILKAIAEWMKDHGFDCSRWNDQTILCEHRQVIEAYKDYDRGARSVLVEIRDWHVLIRGGYDTAMVAIAPLGDPRLFDKIAEKASSIIEVELCKKS